MGNYQAWARNPATREIELANVVQHCFGQHHYGVRFGGGWTFEFRKVEILTFADVPQWIHRLDPAGDIERVPFAQAVNRIDKIHQDIRHAVKLLTRGKTVVVRGAVYAWHRRTLEAQHA